MRTRFRESTLGLSTGAVLVAALLSGCEYPQPAAESPATTQSAAATRTAAEPELASMTLAVAASKLSVPVDLRYLFEGETTADRPVTLHLAAVPRIAGNNLAVNIKEVPGVRMTDSALGVQKASASTAYRQQLSVTRLTGGPPELRVLVTMEFAEGSAFGWFSVPFNTVPASTGQRSDKQR